MTIGVLQHPMRFLVLFLLLFFSTGCSGNKAEKKAAFSYAEQTAPIFRDNIDVWKNFKKTADKAKESVDKEEKNPVTDIQLASRLKDALGDSKDVLEQLQENVTPKGKEIKELHSNLIDAWTRRTESYEKFLQSFEEADTEIFEEAEELFKSYRKREEQALYELDQLMSKYKIKLVIFPDPHPEIR